MGLFKNRMRGAVTLKLMTQGILAKKEKESTHKTQERTLTHHVKAYTFIHTA